ncbi:exo-alpha-sialidase [Trypanosoma cruzi]|nr:exo-alpha-sialidase [Trypanosoma cruzi]
MHIAVDLDASFVVHAGDFGWLLLPLVGMKGRRREGAHTASHSSCGCDAPPVTAVEGRILSVCASPPLCRALAHVICYARACWACVSGALGGHHLSMAACVSEHMRMRVRAHGMKEWLEERGI